jgi:hypothetical protein
MNKKHKLLHKDNEYITSKLEIIYEEDIQRIVEERNNLQSKINKAIEVLNKKYEEDKEMFKGDYDFKFILDFEEELLDILKENE